MSFLDELEQEPFREVDIEGMAKPVKIYRFGLSYFEQNVIGKTKDLPISRLALVFLNPEGYKPNDSDEEALKKKIGIDQIAAIYKKGMSLNGVGEEAFSNAKKPSEASEER